MVFVAMYDIMHGAGALVKAPHDCGPAAGCPCPVGGHLQWHPQLLRAFSPQPDELRRAGGRVRFVDDAAIRFG